MKEVLKFKKDIESSTMIFPELDRYVGKTAEITITIEVDNAGRASLRDRLMDNITYLPFGASFLDAEARERFDLR